MTSEPCRPPDTPAPIWHLYLIECSDGSLYAGISTDVAARYAKHCSGKGARYTRAKPPLRLVGAKPCGSKSAALKQEWAIRQLSPPEKIAAILAPQDQPISLDHPANSS